MKSASLGLGTGGTGLRPPAELTPRSKARRASPPRVALRAALLFTLGPIRFLGYKRFDEYKVMGLAPYGDPDVFRDVFRELISCDVAGQITIAPRTRDTIE